MSDFELDPRLEQESIGVCHLPLCEVRLRDDARFAWVIMVPRHPALEELHDLHKREREMLIDELAEVSNALKAETGALKINVGALGNIVRQLHVHVVARNEGDAAWPGPVWGVGERAPMDIDARNRLAEALRARLMHVFG